MSATFDIQQTVRHMVRRLVERYQPERVVLFGSAAYGEPDEDSDIDILIIKETAQSPWSVEYRCAGCSTIRSAALPSHRSC